MRKKILTLAAAAAMTMAMSVTAFAGVALHGTRGNWIQDSTGWWWQNEDGTWLDSGWYWLDGNEDGIAECYLFDGNGYMMSNTVSADGFRVNADGAWVDANGVVQTRSTAAQPAQTTDNQTVNTNVALNSDNGGYNEYGCSNAAIEMLHNTREQNAKFGEVSVLQQVNDLYIVYANGFGVVYPNGMNVDNYDAPTYTTVQVDRSRSDLDGTYLFKYFDPSLNVDEAADYLHSIGFADGIDGTYSDGLTCWISVGNSSTLNWDKNIIVLR